MFGFFPFAWPLFADVPFFGTTPPVFGSGGSGGDSPKHHRLGPNRRELEAQIEISLLTFLNTQD